MTAREITVDELYENFANAYREIVVADCKGELGCQNYDLVIDADGAMAFYPRPKDQDPKRISYESDPELQDMSVEEAIEWAEDCLSSSKDGDYEYLEKLYQNMA